MHTAISLRVLCSVVVALAASFFGSLAHAQVTIGCGEQWSPVGQVVVGTNSPVLAVTTSDPDGTGPQATQVFVGGAFTSAGGKPVNSIARWDGTW